MTETINAQPLNQYSFQGFGDVIEARSQPSVMINEGNCARYHDLATLEFVNARAGISVFQARPYSIPHSLRMMERHPLGSQAFLPLSDDPFLVIVAEDHDGVPGIPKAFLSNGRQGVNYYRNTWHGVLSPLTGSGLFAVVDRVGDGENLQENWFENPYLVTL